MGNDELMYGLSRKSRALACNDDFFRFRIPIGDQKEREGENALDIQLSKLFFWRPRTGGRLGQRARDFQTQGAIEGGSPGDCFFRVDCEVDTPPEDVT